MSGGGGVIPKKPQIFVGGREGGYNGRGIAFKGVFRN